MHDDVILLCLASSTTLRRQNLLVALAQYTVTHIRSSSTKSSSWFLSSLLKFPYRRPLPCTERTPCYSDYYGQFAWFQKKESHYNFSNFNQLNTDIFYGHFSVRINVTVVTKALILALFSFLGGPLSAVEPSPQKVLETPMCMHSGLSHSV